jgi:hypothetical protein
VFLAGFFTFIIVRLMTNRPQDDLPDDLINYITGTGQKLFNVHSKDQCHGEHCVIHNPSDHKMSKWKTHWRGDRGIMERICPEHGVGHPDPDSLAFKNRNVTAGDSGYDSGIHGCCGCCAE